MMNTEPELSEQDRICLAVADPLDCAGPVTSEPSFSKCNSFNPVMRRRLRVNSSTRAPVGLYPGSPLSQTPGVFGNSDCGNAIPVNKNRHTNEPAAKDTLRPGDASIVFILTSPDRFVYCQLSIVWPLSCGRGLSVIRKGITEYGLAFSSV